MKRTCVITASGKKVCGRKVAAHPTRPSGAARGKIRVDVVRAGDRCQVAIYQPNGDSWFASWPLEGGGCASAAEALQQWRDDTNSGKRASRKWKHSR